MTHDAHNRLPGYDPEAITATIERALASAGLHRTSPMVADLQQTLQRALHPHAPQPAVPPDEPGTVHVREFSHPAGARSYRVYVPARRLSEPAPVVVMLHGCTQSAADFALGTGMNALAERHGCIVVYPEQAAGANVSRCWNWFQPGDQQRGAGEPAVIAGIVQDVLQRDGGDPRRVFVAGLSAGAAMAVVLGETYPELFAGVGVHSGLPFASASDVSSALAAMKGGRGGPAVQAAAGAPRRARQAPRTIVFHGDRDTTVGQANADRIVQQLLAARAQNEPGGALQCVTASGRSAGGRTYTVDTHVDAQGVPCVESWTVHGAGHAWSGGRAAGSFTDASGPDASAEMLRFFLRDG